jgi:hypothetical protein
MRSYPWPASGISREDMALLHQARQRSRPRTPINELIVRAIRQTYAPTQQVVRGPADNRNPGTPESRSPPRREHNESDDSTG